MTQTNIASATSLLLAAIIVAATWLPTVSTPSAQAAPVQAGAQVGTPAHVILA